MHINNIFQSKGVRFGLLGIIVLAVLLLVFRAGMFVGFRKANFSYRWGENYHRNFGGPRGGFLPDFVGKDYTDAHGVSGSILKIDGATLVMKGRGDVEKVVLLKESTTIKRFQNTIALTDLHVGDVIVVIGTPNDLGQIEAELIRVMPAPQKR